MSQWYYVAGTERVGPIEMTELLSLYNGNKINQETYVWRKGFANWEKYKNVDELVNQPEVDLKSINFNDIEFSWDQINEQDQIFYIKIGMDRSQHSGENIYGPYSLEELRAAKSYNRISLKTWIYSIGMNAWITVGETPICTLDEKTNEVGAINEAPWIFVWDLKIKEMWGIVIKTHRNGAILKTGMSASKFDNKNVEGVLKNGKATQSTPIKLNFRNYNPAKQEVEFSILNSFEEWNRIFS